LCALTIEDNDFENDNIFARKCRKVKMKRSEINRVVNEAQTAFQQHGWALPPHPRWDVADFGLRDFNRAQVNGEWRDIPAGRPLMLSSGERVTLTKGILHAFWADSEYAIVGEVSTANDDAHDNYFEDKRVGRFSRIDEDAPAFVKLVSD